MSARRALAFVIFGAILLAGGALLLAFTRGGPASSLLQHVLTIQVIVVLLTWSLLAWSARRLTVGKTAKSPPELVDGLDLGRVSRVTPNRHDTRLD